MRIDETEKDMSISYLTDIQDKPKLFYFMLSLLAEIYQQMPEKEMLISLELIFIDEAHLILKKLVKHLSKLKLLLLIRSKGIASISLPKPNGCS
jgi:hypothetical protein